MRPLAGRRLTEAERALAWEMFGERLDADRIRLFALPLWPRAFVPGPSLIAWPARGALVDFGQAPARIQATFVHELTHVWQAQRGINLLLATIKAGDDARAYAYDLAAGPPFARLNIEQQAMIVEHAFLASRGEAAPFPDALYAKIVSEWRGA
jgi:hypothetical protein